MRKLLAYSLCIGMAFVGAYPSHAEYPDGKVLLERLGIKIDKDGKPVADGTGGCLPDALAGLLAGSTTEKLTQLCGNETALEEERWNNHCIPCKYNLWFVKKMGIIPNEADSYRISDLVRSREFLTGVFGEDFVLGFLKKAWNGTERVYTELVSNPQFPEYCSLYEKYIEKSRKSHENYENWIKQKKAFYEEMRLDCQRLRDKYSLFEKEFYTSIEAFGQLLERNIPRYVPPNVPLKVPPNVPLKVPPNVPLNVPLNVPRYTPRNLRLELFLKSWYIFRNVSIKSDFNEIRLAEGNILKGLRCWCLLGYYKDKNPVRISFMKLRILMDKYLNLISGWRRHWEMKEAELEVGKELLNEMKAYRERFKGRMPIHEVESFPISTEPVTVDIRIYQEHFEDANDARKLRTEDWEQRVVDLDIKLRLTIDTRTRKLLSAFCKDRFIMNNQEVTYFGTGFCIFKSEQPQGFAEEKK